MPTAVKEKPILMSAPMVLALLDGRKTMTRRLAKIPGICNTKIVRYELEAGSVAFYTKSHASRVVCPPYEVGDRLWVRESLQRYNREQPTIQYVADMTPVVAPHGMQRHANGAALWHWKRKSLPSIHCPRWASRITLEISEVRVEQVRDISTDDILAEGIQCTVSGDGHPLIRVTGKCPPSHYHRSIDLMNGERLTHEELLRAHWASAWDSINGSGSWDSNPWVWVISFKRV